MKENNSKELFCEGCNEIMQSESRHPNANEVIRIKRNLIDKIIGSAKWTDDLSWKEHFYKMAIRVADSIKCPHCP